MLLSWIVFILVYCCGMSHASTTPSPVRARLVGDNRPPNAGRLQVYYNGTWGTVCSNFFGHKDARVACYMLGFGRAGLYIEQRYGSGTGQVWLDELGCSGQEQSLAECPHSGWGVKCPHQHDVSIVCGRGNCSATHQGCETVWNTNVQTLYSDLISGSLTRDRIQSLCSSWSTCRDNVHDEGCMIHDLFAQVLSGYISWKDFFTNDAVQHRFNEAIDSLRLLCRRIEPDYDVYRPCYRSLLTVLVDRCSYTTDRHTCSWLQPQTYCYARAIQRTCNSSAADISMLKTIVYNALFSNIIVKPCLLDFNQLIGDAADLRDVYRKIAHVRARLVGDNRPPNAGRLEVYHNGTWGTVCSRFFNNKDARVACYMLGFGRAGLYLEQHFGSGTVQAWLDTLECTGHEHSLAECHHSGWGAQCTDNLHVSIVCGKGNCSATHQGCEAVWNTNVQSLYSDLIEGSLTKAGMQSLCSSWSTCRRGVHDEGCTMHDLFAQVLSGYSSWKDIFTEDAIQDRYNKAIDSLRLLCKHIEPEDDVYRRCYESNLLAALQKDCSYSSHFDCSQLLSRTRCYAGVINRTCSLPTHDVSLLKTIIYNAVFSDIINRPCPFDMDQLIANATGVVRPTEVPRTHPTVTDLPTASRTRPPHPTSRDRPTRGDVSTTDVTRIRPTTTDVPRPSRTRPPHPTSHGRPTRDPTGTRPTRDPTGTAVPMTRTPRMTTDGHTGPTMTGTHPPTTTTGTGPQPTTTTVVMTTTGGESTTNVAIIAGASAAAVVVIVVVIAVVASNTAGAGAGAGAGAAGMSGLPVAFQGAPAFVAAARPANHHFHSVGPTMPTTRYADNLWKYRTYHPTYFRDAKPDRHSASAIVQSGSRISNYY